MQGLFSPVLMPLEWAAILFAQTPAMDNVLNQRLACRYLLNNN